MDRQTTTPPLTCVTCELEIVGRAEFLAGLPFCCSGCVVGGPCLCSYDLPASFEADEVLEDLVETDLREPVLAGLAAMWRG